MKRAFVFDKVAVIVQTWQEPMVPPERGARVELRLLADEPRRGSYAAAQRIVVDLPVWRADLFDQTDAPSGNLRAAHFHPHFNGVEPCDRVWPDDLPADPVAWLERELSDVGAVCARAGVTVDGGLDDDRAAVKEALSDIVATVQAAWAQARS